MSLNELKAADKAVSEILSCALRLVEGVKRASQEGDSFDSLEREVWNKIRKIGFEAMELFIRLQGQGDLGPAVPAFETANKRPGNRRMANVASVYSVNRFERTAADIVAALFRDDHPTDEDLPKRPRPTFKHTTAHFAKQYPDGDEVLAVSATQEAFGWAAGEIERRHRSGQPLVLLMDGQHSLWDTAALYDFPGTPVEILDIVHVSSYVWSAAKLLETERAKQLAFTRQRLLRILEGDVASVVRGLRARAAPYRRLMA